MKTKLDELNEKKAQLEKEIDSFELDPDNYEDQYNDFIDDATGTIKILGMSYTASHVLKEIDPIAYNCGLSDYVDGIDKEDSKDYQTLIEELEEIESEIEDLEMEEEEEEEEE